MKIVSVIAFALAITTFSVKSYALDLLPDLLGSDAPSSDSYSGDDSYGGDPISNVKSNIDLTLKNYGDNSTHATITNIDSSSVDVGTAGNTALLEGTVENFSMAAESYGNNLTNATVGNVSASTVGVISAGNAVTLR